jgi:hypothetical protein
MRFVQQRSVKMNEGKSTKFRAIETIMLAALLMAIPIASGASSLIYGVKSCGSNSPGFCSSGTVPNSLPPTTLFSFQSSDPVSSFSNLGTLMVDGAGTDVDGLAMSQGQLFAFKLIKTGSTTTGSNLITIDASTAQGTTIGNTLDNRDIRGATFDPAGNLLAIDAAANELLTINTTTGDVVGSPVPLNGASGPFDVSDSTDIAFDSDGTFFMTDLTEIFILDQMTGGLTNVFTDTTAGLDGLVPGIAGLAFDNEASINSILAYDVQGEDDIFIYDSDSSFTRTLALSDIVGSFNAGRGDLTTSVVPLPAAGLLFPFGILMLFLGRRHITRQN